MSKIQINTVWLQLVREHLPLRIDYLLHEHYFALRFALDDYEKNESLTRAISHVDETDRHRAVAILRPLYEISEELIEKRVNQTHSEEAIITELWPRMKQNFVKATQELQEAASCLFKDFLHDLSVAYLRNCAHLMVWKGEAPSIQRYSLQQMLPYKRWDWRYMIDDILAMGRVVANDNSFSFNKLRSDFAVELCALADLQTDDEWAYIFYDNLLHESTQLQELANWDEFVCALMLTAEVVCNIMQKNGNSKRCRKRIAVVHSALANLVPGHHGFHLFQYPFFYQEKKLRSESRPWYSKICIGDEEPIVEPTIGIIGHQPRERFEGCINRNEISATKQEEIEREFVPISSPAFKGVCYPPVPTLLEQAFNTLGQDDSGRNQRDQFSALCVNSPTAPLNFSGE